MMTQAYTRASVEYEVLYKAIRALAALDDDHAREQNGVGFSGTTQFGHVLARAESWSPKMAEIAFEIAMHHRKQLRALGFEDAIPDPKERAPRVPSAGPKITQTCLSLISSVVSATVWATFACVSRSSRDAA